MTDVRERLEALAQDESEDEETREWALSVLEGREELAKPKPRADGGAGRGANDPGGAPSHLGPDGFGRMNDAIRDAARRSRYG